MPILTPTGTEAQIAHKAGRVKGNFLEGLEWHPESFVPWKEEGVDCLDLMKNKTAGPLVQILQDSATEDENKPRTFLNTAEVP